MASVHHCFTRLPERQRLPRCYTPHRFGGGLQPLRIKSRMEVLLGRLRQGGYLPADCPSVETLAVAANHKLFVSIASNHYHVLKRLYPEKEACGNTTFVLGLIALHFQSKMIITLSHAQ